MKVTEEIRYCAYTFPCDHKSKCGPYCCAEFNCKYKVTDLTICRVVGVSLDGEDITDKIANDCHIYVSIG